MTVQTPIGEITADEKTLNMLSIFAFDYAIHNEEQGYTALSEEGQNVANEIHKALSESGYYDCIRK